MRTVYVVVEGGAIRESFADHLTKLIVIDLDTDPETKASLEADIAGLKCNPNIVETL